jgi:hypothetical protein
VLSGNSALHGIERGVDVLLSWAPDGAHVIGPVHPSIDSEAADEGQGQ